MWYSFIATCLKFVQCMMLARVSIEGTRFSVDSVGVHMSCERGGEHACIRSLVGGHVCIGGSACVGWSGWVLYY